MSEELGYLVMRMMPIVLTLVFILFVGYLLDREEKREESSKDDYIRGVYDEIKWFLKDGVCGREVSEKELLKILGCMGNMRSKNLSVLREQGGVVCSVILWGVIGYGVGDFVGMFIFTLLGLRPFYLRDVRDFRRGE